MAMKQIREWIGSVITGKAPVGVAQLLQLGKPVWMNRNAKAYAKEGYSTNVVVFRCVDVISKSLASIPLVVTQNGKETDETHPLVKLLARPNPRMTRARMMHSLAAFRLIVGTGWLEKIGGGLDDTETSAKNPPKELWVWQPYHMMPIVGAGKGNLMPVGFQFDDGQHKMGWDVDQLTGRSCMLQWMTFNPLNQWVGMSPIEAMARSVDQRNSADAWNQSLLQNSAQPSGMITSDKVITVDNRKQMREQLEKKQVGPFNAGRPLITGNGIKFEQMSLSPKDMDWLEGKNVASRDICAAYGTPTQLAGIQGDQTFANFAEARLALWEDTVIPLGADLVEELNHWFADDFPGAVISMDLDKIPALAPRRAAKWKMAQESTFISTDEKRALVDLPPVEPKQGDGTQILVAGQLITLEEVTSDPGEFQLRLGAAGLGKPPAKLTEAQANRLQEYLDELKANGNGKH